jgi:cell pole-organizing protein PopZ
MGDISAEPSMEDILSSIKRIIAEEGDVADRPRRVPRPVINPTPESREVLELSEPVAVERPFAQAEQVAAPQPVRAAVPDRPEALVSQDAVDATRGPLDALSRLIVKPETAGSDTLEGMVREMVRPMLREWLDAKLPAMVEQMVAREISRITGQR